METSAWRAWSCDSSPLRKEFSSPLKQTLSCRFWQNISSDLDFGTPGDIDQENTAAKPAIAVWLQSTRCVGRVAELGSLGVNMGVESKFYILPDTSGYRPDAGKVSELVKALRAAGFLCDPKSPRLVTSAPQNDSLSSQADYEGFHWRVGRNKGAGALGALELFLTEHREADVLVQWQTRHISAIFSIRSKRRFQAA
jgi:hypothetical protein